jgi:hypothetical protein
MTADSEQRALLWYEVVEVRRVLSCSLGVEMRQAQTGGDLSYRNGCARGYRIQRDNCVQYSYPIRVVWR